MSAASPRGVRWVTDVPGDGFGDAGSEYMDAIEALGVPVTWSPLVWAGGALVEDHEYRGPNQHRAHRPIEFDVVVVQGPLDDAVVRHADHGPARRVAVTTWETDRPPDRFVSAAAGFDAIVVPSAFNRDALLSAGCGTPVHAVPHVVRRRDPVAPGAYPGVGDRFAFYTIGTWSTRKAMAETTTAFLDAFSVDDDVALVVKTTARDQQSVAQLNRGLQPFGLPRWPVATWAVFAQLFSGRSDVPPVHLVTSPWTAAEIDALHRRGDCFVSLARSEGWGLCITDALASGNPAIVTGWSAPVDYLGAEYPLFVDYDLVSTADERPDDWFERGEGYRWARARHDHAVEQLRWVADHRDAASAIARPHGERVLRECAPDAVGRLLLAVLAGDATASVSGADP